MNYVTPGMEVGKLQTEKGEGTEGVLKGKECEYSVPPNPVCRDHS